VSARAPDPAAVLAAVEVLISNLQYWFRPPAKPGALTDSAVRRQLRFVAALKEVANFLDRCDAGEDIVRHFVELQGAINELRSGTVADLVRPAIVDHNPPDGIVTWSYRHEVVIGLECLMRSGKRKSLKDASKHIAKKYPALDQLKSHPNKDLAGSILSWRSNIRDRKAPASSEMIAHQLKFFEGLGTMSSTEMYARGEQCLANIANLMATQEKF
jgi:hypothetical protein